MKSIGMDFCLGRDNFCPVVDFLFFDFPLPTLLGILVISDPMLIRKWISFPFLGNFVP